MSRFAHLLLAGIVLWMGCERSPQRQSEKPDDPSAPRRADHGAESVEVRVVPVQGNIHMLAGRGGNIGVSAGEDGVLLIDDQFAELAPEIKEAVASLTDAELTYVLNTHHHPDHTGGNPIFGEEATLVAHENVRRRLQDRGDPEPALPVITFSDRMSIHFNGEEIRAVHFANGHTDGDIVIFFTGSGVAHLGDHFFNGRFPYVDLEAGGNAVKLRKNIDAILELLPEEARVIPGHGPLADVEDLRAYREMLVSTTAHVKEKMEAGRSLEAIQKAGLPAKWKDWGAHFVSTEKWIATIYRSLERD